MTEQSRPQVRVVLVEVGPAQKHYRVGNATPHGKVLALGVGNVPSIGVPAAQVACERGVIFIPPGGPEFVFRIEDEPAIRPAAPADVARVAETRNG